ncbi:hypothetical protein PENSPDRAFT_84241 [Peniophora sp. CONT]|nr:hypothetical protein PENSPDRAFT_84241 [Peniophora sp. CONT]
MSIQTSRRAPSPSNARDCALSLLPFRRCLDHPMDSQHQSPDTAQRDGDDDDVLPMVSRTDHYACLEGAPAIPAPVLLIDTDVLVLIFTLVAEYETPSKTSLGWIKLSHVCGAWRLVLLGMSNLWARDAYIFGGGVASKYILPRARDSPISVSRIRIPVGLDGKLFTSFAPGNESCVLLETRDQLDLVLSMVHRGTLRDLNVWFNDERTSFKDDSPLLLLAHRLSHQPQSHLRSVVIEIPLPNKDILETGELHPIAPHPLLQKPDPRGSPISR